jgi:hypothetical protein
MNVGTHELPTISVELIKIKIIDTHELKSSSPVRDLTVEFNQIGGRLMWQNGLRLWIT